MSEFQGPASILVKANQADISQYPLSFLSMVPGKFECTMTLLNLRTGQKQFFSLVVQVDDPEAEMRIVMAEHSTATLTFTHPLSIAEEFNCISNFPGSVEPSNFILQADEKASIQISCGAQPTNGDTEFSIAYKAKITPRLFFWFAVKIQK